MKATATQELITAERALELLREAVAEAGANFTYAIPADYDNCVYSYSGQPSCLVGRALFAAGARIEDLDELCDGAIKGVRQVGTLQLEWDATEVFNAAQALQDEGLTWGEALRAASDVFDGLEYTQSGGAA